MLYDLNNKTMLMRKGGDIYKEFKTLMKENGEIGPYLFHLMESPLFFDKLLS